jgi:hypothetical protein
MEERETVGLTGRVIEGVLGFWDAAITISRRRGIPRVTFAAPCPEETSENVCTLEMRNSYQQNETY